MQDLQQKPFRLRRDRQLLFYFCVLLPLLLLTFLTTELVHHHLFAFDLQLLGQIHQFANPILDDAAITMSYLGGMPVGSVMLLVVLGYAYFRRRQYILFILISLVGAVNVSWLLKVLMNRPRPMLWPRLVQDYGASFPSGHSVYAASFACVFILLFWQTRWCYIVMFLGLTWMLLMGVSRIYLGVHFPSDVLGGWALGWAWVFLVYLGLHIAQKKWITSHHN
jgi:membrane-associated phospholipid phosphatase